MDNPPTVSPREDYGIDAPGVVRANLIFGLAACALAAGMLLQAAIPFGEWGPTLLVILLFIGLSLILTAGIMVHGSRVAKLRLRDRLLAQLPFHGDERLLDVGCGRGLLLVGAAKRLPEGCATGLDVWRGADQSGNTPARARSNARAAGVRERIDLATGDARAMPYPAAAFDIVTSSWAIHNLPTRESRQQAVRECLRVLRPGGWLAIADIARIEEYAEALETAGVRQIARSRPYFVFAIPTVILIARKP